MERAFATPVEKTKEGTYVVHKPHTGYNDIVYVNGQKVSSFPVTISDVPKIEIFRQATRTIFYRSQIDPEKTMTPEEHQSEQVRLRSKGAQTEDGFKWSSLQDELTYDAFNRVWAAVTEPVLVKERDAEIEITEYLEESDVPRFMRKVDHVETVDNQFKVYKKTATRMVHFDEKQLLATVAKELLEENGFVDESKKAESSSQIYKIFDYSNEVTVYVGGKLMFKKERLQNRLMKIEEAKRSAESLVKEMNVALAPAINSNISLTASELVSHLRLIKESVMSVQSKVSTVSEKRSALRNIDELIAKIQNSALNGAKGA
nr:hypothetical protein BdHM001_34730 [Bdellovibrio sp. HM001]